MNQADQPKQFSLESTIKRIKEIQQLLQGGELPFDKSLELYAEAERLIRQSQQYLSQAELKIQHLTGESSPENE